MPALFAVLSLLACRPDPMPIDTVVTDTDLPDDTDDRGWWDEA